MGWALRRTRQHPFSKKEDAASHPQGAPRPKHIQIMGDTGTGKSTIIKQLLQQIASRGELAIVYDPAGEFTETFYNEGRGDWILNPLDKPRPLLDAFERVEEPSRGPDYRRVHVPAARGQARASSLRTPRRRSSPTS